MMPRVNSCESRTATSKVGESLNPKLGENAWTSEAAEPVEAAAPIRDSVRTLPVMRERPVKTMGLRSRARRMFMRSISFRALSAAVL
jgi:hypothetical protein